MITFILSGISRWLCHRKAVRELANLSDHMLSDIGVRPGEIATIAKQTRL
jgi:uncharacterized protein YjiS (DUF1127 family)